MAYTYVTVERTYCRAVKQRKEVIRVPERSALCYAFKLKSERPWANRITLLCGQDRWEYDPSMLLLMRK